MIVMELLEGTDPFKTSYPLSKQFMRKNYANNFSKEVIKNLKIRRKDGEPALLCQSVSSSLIGS